MKRYLLILIFVLSKLFSQTSDMIVSEQTIEMIPFSNKEFYFAFDQGDADY